VAHGKGRERVRGENKKTEYEQVSNEKQRKMKENLVENLWYSFINDSKYVFFCENFKERGKRGGKEKQ